MRVGAIDLGTNSFLCLIADVNESGKVKVVEDLTQVVRLGEGVNQNKCFSKEALERADKCLKSFRLKLNSHNTELVQAVATSAARDAENANELLKIAAKHNIDIKIISGQKEAELTYEGVATDGIKRDDFCILDIGGGSTEFAWMVNKKINLKSFDVGCVRLTEAPRLSLDALIPEFDLPSKVCIAVAGTPTTLSAIIQNIDYDPQYIDNSVITLAEMTSTLARLENMTVSELKNLKGLEPKRADVIVAGNKILVHVCNQFGFNSVFVSVRGVRFGLAKLLGIDKWC